MASPTNIGLVLLASEWGSKRGEVSTFNRELAIQFAKQPDVQVSVFVPRCDQEEKNAALNENVTLVQATRMPGFVETDWLSHPPDDLRIDFIIGHGVELGRHAQVIKRNRKCRWIQFVHTDPEELGMFKDDPDVISKAEKRHRDEVDLCVMADYVVAVGPKLAEAYRSYLRSSGRDQDVFVFTPGIFREFSDVVQSKQDGSKCRVLAFGHGSAEDFSLKGFDIAAKAVAKLDDAQLIFVGAQTSQQGEIASRLKEYRIPPSRLKVRALKESREQFSEVDLAIMPSRAEGFGLVALEAMSAGLPVLVSRNSGFGEALDMVLFGSQCAIFSEDADDWAEKIKKVWTKQRHLRLGESKIVRDSYAGKYKWGEQCKELVEKMRSISSDAASLKRLSISSSSSTEDSIETVTVVSPSKKRKLNSGAVKPGCPSEKDLQLLAKDLGDDWRSLASCLGFTRAEITAFHRENGRLADKAKEMLLDWKKRNHNEATYQVLYEALCHKLVGNKELAEKFCRLT